MYVCMMYIHAHITHTDCTLTHILTVHHTLTHILNVHSHSRLGMTGVQGNSKVPSRRPLLAASTASINVLEPLGVANPERLKSSRQGRPATHNVISLASINTDLGHGRPPVSHSVSRTATHTVINLASIPLTPRGDGHRNTELGHGSPPVSHRVSQTVDDLMDRARL